MLDATGLHTRLLVHVMNVATQEPTMRKNAEVTVGSLLKDGKQLLEDISTMFLYRKALSHA